MRNRLNSGNYFKLSIVVATTILSFGLVSCNNDPNSIIEETEVLSSSDFFTKDIKSNEVNVFFFDIDNINNGLETERTHETEASISVGSCDSYIVKVGNTEILIDCGYQTFASSDSHTRPEPPYQFRYQHIEENVQKNILPKIASICTDGVLEYLIVTHSDFDHLASLCVEGGVIDAFNNEQTITNLNGDPITLKSISNVIDFNSGVVALHSYSKIDKDKRLCRGLYQTYLSKIDSLIKKETNYLPAAALFDSSIETEDKSTMSKENKLLATPDTMKEYVEGKFETTILTEQQPNSAASEFIKEVKKNSSYSKCVAKLGGNLKVESNRYFYSINLENIAEFRILYNWYYDFAYRQNFDDGNRGQPINNPSVCLEVIKNNFKFLSCGDLGGNGENGLINYYKDTSVLKDVTLFRPSHHGSTTNGENSLDLFKTITPKIIAVTGCAQSPLEPKLPKAAFMKQGFFDNIYDGLHDKEKVLIKGMATEPYIFCTNINWFRLNESNNLGINESKPFYGDIRIRTSPIGTKLNYSYKGNIHAFIKNGGLDGTLNFSTVAKRKLLKVQETAWFDKVGFTYGGK